MGLSVYVRAIALPLIVLGGLHFRARGARWIHAATRTAAALVVALALLIPWGIRNHRRYGEFFLTDSHGGHTALVGANPNSEGTYSRSLNRLFSEGTGYSLFKPPHRESDRVAYDLAVHWTKLSPGYALGLLVAKADRLLGRERSLLYWPLYRQSVLPHGTGDNWFDVHRTGIERLVDGFWCFLLGMTVVGILAAWFGRNWPALSLLPLPLGLAAVYTLFFAEPRYQMGIVVLLIPFAGAGIVWTIGAAVDLFSRRGSRRRLVREAVVAGLVVAALFVGWPRLVRAAERLRARDRWAAFVCQVGGAKRVCEAVPADLAPGAPSPVRGVWDGFGLSLRASRAAAALDLPLAAGTYQIALHADTVSMGGEPVDVVVRADGRPMTEAAVSPNATETTMTGKVDHTGGNLHLEIQAARRNSVSDGGTLWISGITIETDHD
jgi:hypothetical protein